MRYLNNDAFNSYLIEDAMFYGKYEMPILENTVKSPPKDIVPFEKRKKIKNKNGVYLHFYMNDEKLKAYLNNAKRYLKEVKKFAGIISLDISIYTDLPLAEQISHSFKNKAFSCFFQNNGINVIPNVRWGDKRSFEFCFDGIKPNGIYAISTYGCIKSKKEKKIFKRDLKEMLKRLTPRMIIVHGRMPNSIFAEYKNKYHFIRFDSWIERAHKKRGGDEEWGQLRLEGF